MGQASELTLMRVLLMTAELVRPRLSVPHYVLLLARGLAPEAPATTNATLTSLVLTPSVRPGLLWLVRLRFLRPRAGALIPLRRTSGATLGAPAMIPPDLCGRLPTALAYAPGILLVMVTCPYRRQSI